MQRHKTHAVLAGCIMAAVASVSASAQAISQLCTPKITANEIVASPKQRYDAGQRAEPSVTAFRQHRLMGSGKRPPRSVIHKLRKIQRKITRSDVKLTLQCYTHSVSEDRMTAAGAMLTAIFSHAADRSGLKAD